MATSTVNQLHGNVELADQLSLGWLHVQSVKNLNQAYQAGRITCSRYFFLSAYQAGVEQAIATLEKLLGQPGASRIDDLIATAEGISALAQAGDELQPPVSQYRVLAQAIRERVSGLRQSRDQALQAHRPDPNKQDNTLASFPPAAVATLEACYRDVLGMAGVVLSATTGHKLHIHQIEAGAQDDVQFLMDMLGGGCI